MCSGVELQPPWQEMLRLHKKDGYFQGAAAASKWPAAREKYSWDMVAELCPKVAAKFSEIPNWLRERFDVDGRKGNGTYKVSDDLYEVVDKILEEVVVSGMELNTTAVEEVLKEALETYNEAVTAWRDEKDKADLEMLQKLSDAGTSEAELKAVSDELSKAKQFWPQTCLLAQTPRALNQQALKFSQKYGYSRLSQDKPQKHLPRNHPSVQRVTEFITTCMKDGSVHPKLVANWDQVTLLQLQLDDNPQLRLERHR